MPPTKDPAHRHSEQAPRSRRKTKPSFDVPPATASSAAPVEWVYRTDRVSSPPPPAARQTEEPSKTDPFFAAGMELFFVGVEAVRMVFLVSLGLVAAPIEIARGFLHRKPDR